MAARAIERLEALLTAIYDLDIGCRVGDFSSPTGRCCPASAAMRRATSSSSSPSPATSSAFRSTSDAALLERLDRHDLSDRLDAANLADCWTALEGISHFLCVAHNAGHDRRCPARARVAGGDRQVRRCVELRRASPWRFPPSCTRSRSGRTRVDPALAAGREPLYRRASREAARFCSRPEPGLRALCRGDDGWLAQPRRFYRPSDFGKLRHIERACAASDPACAKIRRRPGSGNVTTSLIYEVECQLDPDIVADYDAWLPGHATCSPAPASTAPASRRPRRRPASGSAAVSATG